jgi:hypothetical protein
VEEYQKKLVKAVAQFREQGVYIYGIGIGNSADLQRYATDSPEQ